MLKTLKTLLFVAVAFVLVGTASAAESQVKVTPVGGTLVCIQTAHSSDIVDLSRVLRISHWGCDRAQFNTSTHMVWSNPSGFPSGANWVEVSGITQVIQSVGAPDGRQETLEVTYIPAREKDVAGAFLAAKLPTTIGDQAR